ncbi:MAG: hypothetical protein JSU74_02820 [Candidatus Zixiibacteriota bacterium]|nr:MAG: hypothetical protein JSU74_02820 [candidate division Zixibacteria bacterium]
MKRLIAGSVLLTATIVLLPVLYLQTVLAQANSDKDAFDNQVRYQKYRTVEADDILFTSSPPPYDTVNTNCLSLI